MVLVPIQKRRKERKALSFFAAIASRNPLHRDLEFTVSIIVGEFKSIHKDCKNSTPLVSLLAWKFPLKSFGEIAPVYSLVQLLCI